MNRFSYLLKLGFGAVVLLFVAWGPTFERADAQSSPSFRPGFSRPAPYSLPAPSANVLNGNYVNVPSGGSGFASGSTSTNSTYGSSTSPYGNNSPYGNTNSLYGNNYPYGNTSGLYGGGLNNGIYGPSPYGPNPYGLGTYGGAYPAPFLNNGNYLGYNGPPGAGPAAFYNGNVRPYGFNPYNPYGYPNPYAYPYGNGVVPGSGPYGAYGGYPGIGSYPGIGGGYPALGGYPGGGGYPGLSGIGGYPAYGGLGAGGYPGLGGAGLGAYPGLSGYGGLGGGFIP